MKNTIGFVVAGIVCKIAWFVAIGSVILNVLWLLFKDKLAMSWSVPIWAGIVGVVSLVGVVIYFFKFLNNPLK